MMMESARQLVWEAKYIGVDEHRLQAMFDASPTLQRFYKAMGSVYEQGAPYDSEFEWWIGLLASDMRKRLKGETKTNVGTDPKLRFSPDEMNLLIALLEDEQAYWQRARDVFWANQNNTEWREIVKVECNKLDERSFIDDDLLDAIALRTEKGEFQYIPKQVALVSAARRAMFGNKDERYHQPKMAQHKRISEAVKDWRKRFDEAKQLNLRW